MASEQSRNFVPDIPIPPGHWQPGPLPKHIYYGSGCVAQHLLSCLPSSSQVFIISTNSLNKTPLIPQLETLLGSHHTGTIPSIKQHAPLEDIENALSTVLSVLSIVRATATTASPILLSLGGGSAIDAAKIISFKHSSATGSFLHHIAIPTSLSGAECTASGSYTITTTNESLTSTSQQATFATRVKKAIIHPKLAVSTIFYDPIYAAYTPRDLWLSSGIRALDHATECMYHPLASEVPWKALAMFAFGELFTSLRVAAKSPPNNEQVSLRLMLAAYASSGLKGAGIAGMGLSHTLGHAIGSAYGIPHGITSCMTLGRVVKVKAREERCAGQMARLVGLAGGDRTGNDYVDAVDVGERVLQLVTELGLERKLGDYGVGRGEMIRIVKRVVGEEADIEEMRMVEEVVEQLF